MALEITVSNNLFTVEGATVGQSGLAVTLTNNSIIYTDNVPDGSITGDFLRWNESTGAWEVKSEPIAFKGLVLTPAATAGFDIEGGLWYRSSDRSVYVCADI